MAIGGRTSAALSRKCKVGMYSSRALSQRSASFRSMVNATHQRRHQSPDFMSNDASNSSQASKAPWHLAHAPRRMVVGELKLRAPDCLATLHDD